MDGDAGEWKAEFAMDCKFFCLSPFLSRDIYIFVSPFFLKGGFSLKVFEKIFIKSPSQKVLEDSDPEKESRLNKHTSQFPSESEPLLDSAVSFGGKPRSIPLPPQRKFIPVGHICLGQVSDEYAALNYHANDEGAFWISNFYVSRAIQGCGLGTAAMDTAENMAVSEPLNARSLALNAINMVDLEREEKYKALGLSIPLVSYPYFCFSFERKNQKYSKGECFGFV